ncbi:fimbrial protein [Chimaeribacter californicus]|nr:fimbrial protein [Chimaeribacter californicus]
MKRITCLLLLVGLWSTGLLYGQLAWAGGCTTLGGPAHYTFQLDKDEIDTSHNTAGQVLPDVISYYLSDRFPMDCTCEEGSAALYFRSVSALPPGYSDGSLTYYVLDPWLQVGLKLGINGDNPIPAPFEDVSDGGTYACGSDGLYHSPVVEVGNTGLVSLYVTEGFTGQLIIPRTKIMSVYARWGTQGGYSATPIDEIWVYGRVVVPQTCRIGDGEVINVDLGQIRSADIRTRGAMPANYTPQPIMLEYVCNNIVETMQLELTFYGKESTALPGLLQTSNPDIGVQVTDDNMKPFDINGGQVSLSLSYGDLEYQTGQQLLYAWPVNTTGNAPASGPFSASAIIQVEIQ